MRQKLAILNSIHCHLFIRIFREQKRELFY